jgi:hypothetical protein
VLERVEAEEEVLALFHDIEATSEEEDIVGTACEEDKESVRAMDSDWLIVRLGVERTILSRSK